MPRSISLLPAFAGALLLSFSPALLADPSLLIRPQAGWGKATDGASEEVSHAGARLLLSANEAQRYGLELSRFHAESHDFTAAGIVLEQRVGRVFNMSIGTVGYFGFDGSSGNPVGLTTNLGWEPAGEGRVEPFVTYRADFIYARETTAIHSLSVGLSIKY